MNRSVFKGLSVSDGVSAGEIVIIESSSNSISNRKIKACETKYEMMRLDQAFARTHADISALRDSVGRTLKEEERLIFDAYRLVLEDAFFIREIRDMISTEGYAAENAVRMCFDKYISTIAQSENEYARLRIYDLNDLKERIIENLSGDGGMERLAVSGKNIVAVKTLTTSLAAVLGKMKVAGVAAHEGAGFLSHCAIIMRGMGIPVLNGIDYHKVRKYNGRPAILDASCGIFIIDPHEDEIKRYGERIKQDRIRYEEREDDDRPSVTADGYSVSISANISNLREFNTARNRNVEGIGLVRTETLFIHNRWTPDEKSQYRYQ